MRISDWATKFNVEIVPAVGAPGETIWRLVDFFTTRDGSWEPSGQPGSVPQWARDAYLKPLGHPQYNDDGGADRHLFGAVMDAGALVPFFPIEYWTHTDNGNRNVQHSKKHGWANMAMYGGSSFVPERGERGPWAWKPASVKADIVIGGGLPANQHVSWFAVWKPEVVAVVVPDDGPNEQPTDIAALEQRVARLENIIRQWSDFVGEM